MGAEQSLKALPPTKAQQMTQVTVPWYTTNIKHQTSEQCQSNNTLSHSPITLVRNENEGE